MDQSDLLHADDANGKKKPATTSAFAVRRRHCSTGTAVTLLLFVLTNTVSILVSSGAGPSLLRRYKPAAMVLPPLWVDSAALLADLNATQDALAAGRAELAGLYARVGTANELLRTLLEAQKVVAAASTDTEYGGWAREPAGELKLAVRPHRRRRSHGRNGTTAAASEEEAAEVFFPAVGHACGRVQDDLERYMNYTPGGDCPSDGAELEHRLVLGGCDPLPRRRCRPPSPKGLLLPKSLLAMPPATKNDGALTYSVDAVLRTRPNGTVRVGLDIGGGAGGGEFAARMLERGVVTVVVTAGVNSGVPVGGSVEASRGLVLVRVGAAHRLPFFDGTLDIVHAELAGTPDDDVVAVEFAMFDVYRVLRPGGLYWIDRFVCSGNITTFAAVIDRVGFKKLRWNTARKPRRRGTTGNGDEWYVSALLEKSMPS